MDFIYLDAVGGISGDMILAAFADNLVPFGYIQRELSGLNLPDYEIALLTTQKHHLAAKRFVVKSSTQTGRHLSDIEKLIKNSSLNKYVKENSIAVFRRLGKHEARIHQTSIDKVHFHEVGAIDSIIDITGFFICLDYLKPKALFTSPLPVSRGVIKAAHGALPVPAPATLELLQGYPLSFRNIDGELVTPTGAVLVTYISDGTLPEHRQFSITGIGYGAGSKDFEEVPNILRIWKGEFTNDVVHESVMQIETNIDDMNPEFYPHLKQQLFNAGAMDVTLYPGIMKKGRPGTLISILADAAILDKIRRILYEQTSTIGFRYFFVNREKLRREIKEIDSPWGKIKVKAVKWNDELRLIPEYEECARIAAETKVPALEMYNKILAFLTAEE